VAHVVVVGVDVVAEHRARALQVMVPGLPQARGEGDDRALPAAGGPPLLRDRRGAEPVVREAVEAVVAGEIDGVLAGDRPVGIRVRALRELVPRQIGPHHAPPRIEPAHRPGRDQHALVARPVPGLDDQVADAPPPVVEVGVADAAEVAVVGWTDDRVVVQAAEAREHRYLTVREPGKRSMRAR